MPKTPREIILARRASFIAAALAGAGVAACGGETAGPDDPPAIQSAGGDGTGGAQMCLSAPRGGAGGAQICLSIARGGGGSTHGTGGASTGGASGAQVCLSVVATGGRSGAGGAQMCLSPPAPDGGYTDAQVCLTVDAIALPDAARPVDAAPEVCLTMDASTVDAAEDAETGPLPCLSPPRDG